MFMPSHAVLLRYAIVLKLARCAGFNHIAFVSPLSAPFFGARISAFFFLQILAWGHYMSVLDSDRISTVLETEHLADLDFVAFDVETTGLSPVVARLVELSGVKFNLKSEEVSTFSTLIDPEMPIPPEVSQIHGITDDMVEGAPKTCEAVPAFIDWVGDARTVLVAHNAPFDVEFLHVAMARLKRERPAFHVIDTLPFARAALPDSPNHQLRTLVEHLGLEAGDYHRALADSHHVRNLLSRLFDAVEAKTWSDVCEHRCVFPFHQDLYSAEPPAELAEFIISINEAIAAGSAVSFMYSGYRTFKRTVDPVALIQSRGNYYLTAFCKKAFAERTFRLDRISELKSVEASLRKTRAVKALP